MTRQRWGGRIEFLLTSVGYSFGGDLLRFPYLVMKNGGGSFLIPIIVFNILGAMPIVYMELIMGQYSQSGAIPVWNVCPLLKGTGYGTVIITFIFAVYYAVIICWMLLYFIYSFWPTLPWSTCDNDWNIPETCTVTKYSEEKSDETADSNRTMFTSRQLTTNTSLRNDSVVTKMTSSEQFWRYDVLNLSSGLEDLGTIQWPLFGCLAVIEVVCFLCIFKGVKLSGKVVYFTVLGPCVLLAVFLIRGAILPGADIGIKYYLIPDINKLADTKIWAEACMQVFFSIGPGMGSMVTFGSFNRFNNNCMRDAILVCLLDLTMGFIGGFVVFSIMGHVSYRNSIPIDNFSRSGYGLGFIAYPEAANYLPSQLWCALFFFMYTFLGIDSQFPSYEITVTALTDEFPKYLKNKTTLLTLIVIGVSFLLAIPLVTQGGFYLLTLVDWYTATFSLSIISILEIVIMTYVYGINRVNKNMIEMTGKGVPLYFKICWLFVTPVLLGVTVVFACITYVPPVVDAYWFPTWAIVMGWLIAASSLVPIPLYALYLLYNTPGTLIERFRVNIRPNEKWGPVNQETGSDSLTQGQQIIRREVTPSIGNAACDNPAFQTKL